MRPPRISLAGGMYHVTVRCNNREFMFVKNEDFSLFLTILGKAKELYEVRIYAYCLTSNHTHLLLETPEHDNLSAFMQYVNGNFARAYNLMHGRSGRFWGGRFHSTLIESETQFFNTAIYIELNMVRCKAVTEPQHWTWSSYNAHAFGQDNPVLDLHSLYLDLGPTAEQRQQAYRAMVEGNMRDKGMSKQPVLAAGVIVGTTNFVRALLDNLGLDVPYYRKSTIYEHQSCSAIRRFPAPP